MLYQIERRLTDLKKEIEMQKKDATEVRAAGNTGLASADRIPGSKVVAVDVDPEMYAQLAEVAKKHGVRSVRGALMLAAKTGLRHL
jgi:hypothetical protein